MKDIQQESNLVYLRVYIIFIHLWSSSRLVFGIRQRARSP